jgi:hypothetical protein
VAVIIDSRRPTTAWVTEKGKMIVRVPKVSGMLGRRKIGRLSTAAGVYVTIRKHHLQEESHAGVSFRERKV